MMARNSTPSRIGIMAPSSFVEREDIEKSKSRMEREGFHVFIHPQTWEREGQSAGTHLQKTLAFQGLWQRDDIDIIWAAGGGNRCLHLLETINFEALKTNKKTFVGFSDVTALLNAIYAHTGINTIHGPIFKSLHKYEQMSSLLSLLRDEDPDFPIKDIKVLKEGEAKGPLIGGNLSIFQYLPQTLPEHFTKSAILFLEDHNEDLSKIDRMLLHLKRTGTLDKISGLIFGQFEKLQDTGRPFGFTLEELIAEHTENLDIPILMNAPFGHGDELFPLPVGKVAEITTNPAQITF